MSREIRSVYCCYCGKIMTADGSDAKSNLRCQPCNHIYILYPNESLVFDESSVRVETNASDDQPSNEVKL